jgi:hypothetical protein
MIPTIMNNPKAIIVDIDGTLANVINRRNIAQREGEGKFDWNIFQDPFYVERDTPNEWCFDLISRYQKDHKIIFVTGRHEALKNITNEWIEKFGDRYGVYLYSLYMRKDGDYRPDVEIKKEIYERNIKENYMVTLVIDDRKCMADYWRSEGLVCLQCAEGNY